MPQSSQLFEDLRIAIMNYQAVYDSPKRTEQERWDRIRFEIAAHKALLSALWTLVKGPRLE